DDWAMAPQSEPERGDFGDLRGPLSGPFADSHVSVTCSCQSRASMRGPALGRDGKGAERFVNTAAVRCPTSDLSPSPKTGYAKSSGRMGNWRMRLPVAAKMALQTAGAIPGVLASPMPPEAASRDTMSTSPWGVSSIRLKPHMT